MRELDGVTERMAAGRALPQPVWPEVLAEGPRPYYRRRSDIVFCQVLPFMDDGGILQDPEFNRRLYDIREPVALEIHGRTGYFYCQLVAQRQDAELLQTAITRSTYRSHLAEQVEDPLYSFYREIRSQGLQRSYQCHEYYVPSEYKNCVFNKNMLGRRDLALRLHPILNALQSTELGFFQLIFLPCRRRWYVWDRASAVFGGEGLPPGQPSGHFAVTLRVGGFLEMPGATNFLEACHQAIAEFGTSRNHDGQLCYRTVEDNERFGLSEADQTYVLFDRVSYWPGMLLQDEELSTIMPTFQPWMLARIPELAQAGKSYPAPDHSDQGQVLGINSHKGRRLKVRIGPELPNQHMYIVGKSGYGKTTLMENLLRQHIDAGEGFGVIDPHGDLIQRLLPLIPRVRIPQTLYFSPSESEYRIPFNVLANSGGTQEREHLRAELLDFFEELLGDRLGVNIEHVLNHSLITLLSRPDASLADIRRLLTDARFREEIIGSLNNPNLIEFWKQEFPDWSKAGGLMTITNKLSPLLLPGSLMEPVLSSRANELDFASMMSDRGIFLCDISRGKLTRRFSGLLGRLIISRIAITAMMRPITGSLAPWYLYVDEVQDVPSASLEEILHAGRKFGLHLRLANQARRDLPDSLRRAVSNAATSVCFAMDDVAERSEAERFFDRRFPAQEIGSLPKGHAIVKMDGEVFNLEVPYDRGQGPRDVLRDDVRRQFVRRVPQQLPKAEAQIKITAGNMKPARAESQPVQEEVYDEL